MELERLEFLSRIERFFKLLVDQIKTNGINEAEFYLLLGVKCKAMNKERVAKKSNT